MIERTVFLVTAEVAYEGGTPIRAFTSEADATAFCKACSAHDANEPASGIDVGYEARDTWDRSHPAGEYRRYAEGYGVTPLQLFGEVSE